MDLKKAFLSIDSTLQHREILSPILMDHEWFLVVLDVDIEKGTISKNMVENKSLYHDVKYYLNKIIYLALKDFKQDDYNDIISLMVQNYVSQKKLQSRKISDPEI